MDYISAEQRRKDEALSQQVAAICLIGFQYNNNHNHDNKKNNNKLNVMIKLVLY